MWWGGEEPGVLHREQRSPHTVFFLKFSEIFNILSDYPGVETWQECEEKCKDDQICDGFTWFKDSPQNGLEAKKCYLKMKSFVLKQKDGSAMSGMRNC